MGSVLTILEDGRSRVRYECEQYEVFVLGREALAQVARGFPADPYMSRRHVLFEVSGSACCVEDLGSRNGVFVNDTRVSKAPLHPGDVVRAGRTTLRFTVEARAARPQPRRGPAVTPNRLSSADTRVDAVPSARAMSERSAPRTLAGFDILDEVARGGLGVVHRARERDSGRIVALKRMLGSSELDEYARAHFVREMSILSDLHHPNVVRTYDVGAVAGETWISMEYVDGANLEQHVRKHGPLGMRDCLSIGVQLLRGLAHAHARGFVHRDVKPANVLLSAVQDRLTAKLGDFGLAKSLQSAGQTGLTVTGDAKGSAWFVAPEQLEDAKNVDHRADIYSIGASLYFALSGAWHLRSDGKFQEFILSVIRGHYVPIERRVRLPEGFARAINGALARSPAGRPSSAQEMEHALVAVGQQLRRP